MFFCCSNANLKETKTITFDKLNSHENNKFHESSLAPCVSRDNSQKNIPNIAKDCKENSINYNINNIHHYVNNINNISLINNSNYYQRERSNKITNINLPYINTIISNKASFKSLLIKKYNTHLLNNMNNKYKSNNNINNIQFTNNNNIMNNNTNNFQKTHSVISFSNIKVVKNTNTYHNDDTEILSPYELLLLGDIFFNKEIRIDRLGIKSNKIGDKGLRKEHLIKFGIIINNNSKSHKDSDYNQSDFKCKVDKESENLKLDMNSITSSFLKLKEHNLDMILNVDHEKVLKIIDQNEQIISIDNKDEEDFSSPKVKKENKTITLFTIRYIASMELFEFCSSHNSMPVELLLNNEYQLRNGYIYNILLGEVCVVLKVFKNKNDEDILRIRVQDKSDEKNIIDNSNNNLNISKKQEDVYNFNSSNVLCKNISIGRRNCTINIDNETVSDTHLKIRYSDNSDTFSVIDGGSKSGSYLLLNEPFNYLYIKDILSFRLLDTKFNIQFIHNSE
jgi:hypothetical protein